MKLLGYDAVTTNEFVPVEKAFEVAIQYILADTSLLEELSEHYPYLRYKNAYYIDLMTDENEKEDLIETFYSGNYIGKYEED